MSLRRRQPPPSPLLLRPSGTLSCGSFVLPCVPACLSMYYQGTYGWVVRAENVVTGVLVAIKVLKHKPTVE